MSRLKISVSSREGLLSYVSPLIVCFRHCSSHIAGEDLQGHLEHCVRRLKSERTSRRGRHRHQRQLEFSMSSNEQVSGQLTLHIPTLYTPTSSAAQPQPDKAITIRRSDGIACYACSMSGFMSAKTAKLCGFPSSIWTGTAV